VIPEAPFLFSIAALNASMAGLAGLVAGLRRGADFAPIDAFRLRQIVEFAFANVLFSVGIIPLVLLTDDVALTVRIAVALAMVYGLVNALILSQRLRSHGIETIGRWYRAVIALNLGLLLAIIATAVTGDFALYALLLIGLLARPMLAFLFVLASFEREA
jgi:hypothetical protein